jgi:hypothetical protein
VEAPFHLTCQCWDALKALVVALWRLFDLPMLGCPQGFGCRLAALETYVRLGLLRALSVVTHRVWLFSLRLVRSCVRYDLAVVGWGLSCCRIALGPQSCVFVGCQCHCVCKH